MSGSSLLRKIFRDHWERFKRERKPRPVAVSETEKMLSCRDPGRGTVTYKCPRCGRERPVYIACRSRLCTRCGKRHADSWASRLADGLLPENHAHITFTIPEELRSFFLRDRSLLKVLLDSVARSLKRAMRPSVVPGLVAVLHTYGRDLGFKPHVHVLATEGGRGRDGGFRDVNYIDYGALRRIYQYELLTALKRKIPVALGLIDRLFRDHPRGFYVHVARNRIGPRDIAGYIGRYVRHPAIAESRIAAYDGERVTFEFTRGGERFERTVAALDFIGALLDHVPESHFKRVRYYGLYSRSLRRGALKSSELRRAIDRVLRGEVEEEPVLCEACGCAMVPVAVSYWRLGRLRSALIEPLYGDMVPSPP